VGKPVNSRRSSSILAGGNYASWKGVIRCRRFVQSVKRLFTALALWMIRANIGESTMIYVLNVMRKGRSYLVRSVKRSIGLYGKEGIQTALMFFRF